MKYNKHNQAFDIIGRFNLQGADGKTTAYCRVRFLATGYETVFRNDVIQTLDFKDPSLEGSEVLTAPAETSTVTTTEAPPVEPVNEQTKGLEPHITATSPEGEVIEVTDLEAFVAEHDLDLEAVKACIEGTQKTHKKWKFTK